MIIFSTASTDPNIAVAANYLQRLSASVAQLQNQLNYGSNFIFNNSSLTPQQAIAYFSTNANALLQFTSTAAAYLGNITGAPPTFVPVGWTILPKQDGSVTLIPPLSTGGTGSLSI